MNDKKILEKAIKKAIENGWLDYGSLEGIEFVSTTANTITLGGWVEFVEEGQTDEARTERDFNYRELIFSHDFAKALWGEQPTRIPAYSDAMENWQYHLQKMVIASEPIKYLGDNI